jgi:glutamyl-tRNA synthetase
MTAQRKMCGRFAPSPTGSLHLGHAQTMLLCWLQVRAAGGHLVMRIEDVDVGRTRPGAEENILRDLEWLGFDWDELAVQRDRHDLYDAALTRLADRPYPCACSRKEIRAAADIPREYRGEVAYPGTCRSGPSHSDGRPTSLRVRTDGGAVSWHDRVVGACSDRPGDFIVRAKNGDHVYQLACVVDDIEMGVTEVLRGADLLDSTGRQLLLYRWLGAEPPTFAHVPLREDESGARLAKSRGSPALTELRERGDDGAVVLGSIAAELGLLQEPEPVRPGLLLDAFASSCPALCA